MPKRHGPPQSAVKYTYRFRMSARLSPPGLKLVQKPDEIARGEVVRVAQAACAEFLAKFVRRPIGLGKGLGTIACARK